MKFKILAVIIIIAVMILAIKHVAVKSSGDIGQASEWNADHHIDGDVECNQHQHLQHILENRTDWPAGPVKGQIIFRTDLDTAYVWDGTQWVIVAAVRTHYLSLPACAFTTGHPDTNDIVIFNPHSNEDGEQNMRIDAGSINVFAPIYLPHGAIVTEVVLWGNAPAQTKTWELCRLDHAGVVDAIMGTANISTADNTINNATVDNNLYLYVIASDILDINDRIFGARITYTL